MDMNGSLKNLIMPYSSEAFKDEIKRHIFSNNNVGTKMLDVGVGAGRYGRMLSDFFYIDAVEIHAPYIERFNLNEIYNNVYNANILAFDFSPYDYIIMGDILEHIPKYEAMNLVGKINSAGKKLLVAVPYMYEQGESEGNVHEIHHQADLTHEIFLERYPCMKLLYKDDGYGYYINY
jgi:predicted TPR repeat methyltransferase